MQNSFSFIILILIFAVMYFVMIRPQRKKQKQIEDMRRNVKAGDRIVTIGGIKGKIVRIGEEDFMLEVGSDKVRMEFMKWAISKVDEKGVGAKPQAKPAEKANEKEEAAEEPAAPKTPKKPRRLGAKTETPANEAKEAEE
jgi:preprotein translocase subunit YajC